MLATGPVQRTATTGPSGIVTIVALPPGTYTLRATRAGFEPVVGSIVVAPGSGALRFLQLELAAASFADLHRAAGVALNSDISTTGDPIAAHALTAMPNVDLVADGAGPAAAGVSVLETLPSESRVELDGIPIAGGPSARNAVWFRNGLPLEDVEVEGGPLAFDSSLADAVGGVVNFQTPPISRTPQYELAAGYDSEFGSFQRVRYSQSIGPLGFALDTISGGGTNRSQVFKVAYNLSSATSLAFSSYGSQSAATFDNIGVTSNAPAYAADLHTQLGSSTLSVRSWRSSATTQEDVGTFLWPLESDRLAGTQIGLDVPAGNQDLSFSFDRRSDFANVGGASVDSTFTTAMARGDFQLSRDARLELGDVLSGGTLLPARTDPQLGLSYRASQTLTLSAAAGSAYATAPDAILGALPSSVHALAPETSFGWRLAADRQLASGDRMTLSGFDLLRYDVFSNLAGARSEGLELAYAHEAAPGSIGIAGFVDLARSIAFGAVQPWYRSVGQPRLFDGAQLPGDPFSKARLALTYRSRGGVRAGLGATLLGANNAFANGTATTLGDAFFEAPVLQLFDVRLAASNLFGYAVAPALAPLYAPHEVSFSFVRR